MSKEYDYLFKICVVGDHGIGKTDFVKAFIPLEKGHDNAEIAIAIDVDFNKDGKTNEVNSGPKEYIIQIWDIGGDNRWSSFRPKYYGGALGFILFFDLSSRDSFIHLTDWIAEIKDILEDVKLSGEIMKKEEIPIILVGRKSKLEKPIVSSKEIFKFIREHNLAYIETSTKTKEGIVDIFYCLSSLIVGVDIYSEYLLAKDIMYYPNRGIANKNSSHTTLTPQDLNNLKNKLFRNLIHLKK